jgi:hypothetical protein
MFPQGKEDDDSTFLPQHMNKLMQQFMDKGFFYGKCLGNKPAWPEGKRRVKKKTPKGLFLAYETDHDFVICSGFKCRTFFHIQNIFSLF